MERRRRRRHSDRIATGGAGYLPTPSSRDRITARQLGHSLTLLPNFWTLPYLCGADEVVHFRFCASKINPYRVVAYAVPSSGYNYNSTSVRRPFDYLSEVIKVTVT